MAQEKFKGLTPVQVEASRKEYGDNMITPVKRVSMWRLFFEKFDDPIIKILLAAAVVSFGISFVEGGFEEPIGILFAIILATGISFYFERDAGKKFELLTKVNDDLPIRAIRSGREMEIPRRDVVVGDIVIIETGDEIPADGHLLEAVSMQVDESTLTGELMIEKTIDPEEFDKESTYPSDMVLRGTTVLDGHGVMSVDRVGDATQYGQVAKNATQKVEEQTPLNKQLTNLANMISGVAVVLGVVTFFIMVFKELNSAPAESVTVSQRVLLASVLSFLLVSIAKALLPSISKTLSIFKVKTDFIDKAVSKGWGYFISAAIIIAIAVYVVSSLFTGFVSPLNRDTWLDMQVVKHIIDAFMVAVTLIVVVVPEGLPMSITLSLALNMRRMLKTNNLVRKIHASETMGATTVICTDKTGTLTQNKMHVETLHLYSTNSRELDETLGGRLFSEAVSTNTTAQIGYDVEGKETVLGNPTEGALLKYLNGKEINYRNLRDSSVLIKQLTFSTQRKYMATLVASAVTGKRVLYVKGAPEIILAASEYVTIPDGKENIDKYLPEITTALSHFQSKAMRTLAFAWRFVADDDNRTIEEIVADKSLQFLGYVAISDPVRPDVPNAVQRCLNAGVKVKIVTGDTSATAREIGRQIGIWKDGDTDENIIAGSDFAALTDQEAFERAKKLKIMCRARPTDKQRLVNLLQKAGEVVAVTGDGTNDAPALNQAHVGLSMGSGTAVAKEASDITLLDDSFGSIAMAVMWGRSLYRNIQRFLLFQLTVNIVALAVVFIGVFFTSNPPLTVMQMLWVNIIMDTFAAMAFASIRPENNVMQEAPRKNGDFIINKTMFKRMVITSSVFVSILLGMLLYFANTGTETVHNLTLFFTIFVMMQFINIFFVRGYAYKRTKGESLKGMYPSAFVIVALLILLGQILIVQFGGETFRVEPLAPITWGYIIAAVATIVATDFLVKLIKK